MADQPKRVPVSTYRLQLNGVFPFQKAERLAPYLKMLGITEYYCSSFLAAQPGSMHGYDLCDHSRINPEIGGREGFDRFSRTLRENGFGLVLDFVPNHMSTNPLANRWWRDVLASGPSSRYANFFDIDWEPVKSELKNKVLLPVLGDQYGVVLEAGQLQVVFEDGAFHLQYFNLNLPLNPRQLRVLLGHQLERLMAVLDAEDPQLNEFRSILFHLEHMPVYTETDREMVESRHRERDVAMRRIAQLAAASAPVRRQIEENVREFNGQAGDIASFDLLHGLLEMQPYRLSSWRTAMHEINYRRFFDINELAGIRMEEPEAFRQAHELVFALIRSGAVTGLRLDHIDGLYDPGDYLESLAAATSPEHTPYIVVEKILTGDEQLPASWKAQGTTGYEYLNDVNGLFVDSRKEHKFHNLYQRFTGQEAKFAEVVYDSKKLIIQTSMASELNVLAHELNRISEEHRRFRDFTLDSLQEALREIVACFPVYRSYVDPEGWSELDEQLIDQAVTDALLRNPALEPSTFHFIREMLLPKLVPGVNEKEYQRRIRFSMKFQQYTGPVEAKSVEDTAFYRFGPLVSLNEVGGDPDRFGRSPEEFHRANQHRQEAWPMTMLTSSTHDTKRGEDARARINVLSEIPAEWRTAISRWARANEPARTMIRGESAPDRGDEYLYYQALLGAWPAGVEGAPGRDFIDRMRGYMQKAVKEKKVHTSWIHPSEEYDEAVAQFVERSLEGKGSRLFLSLFQPFQQRIAHLGMVNSLGQLVLKIGSPGVPDFYQGAELWDLSLVDPDNRKPVDFELRERWLQQMEPWLNGETEPGERALAIGEMLAQWTDGRIKLFCTAAGLRLRNRLPEVFVGGSYVPLEPEGAAADHVVGFARESGGKRVLVIVPRLLVGLGGLGGTLPLGAASWGDTVLRLPETFGAGRYRNVLSGDVVAVETASLRVADILQVLPVAMLEQESEDSL